MTTPAVARRSRWQRLVARVVRHRAAPQRVFGFIERAERFDQTIKRAIVGVTIVGVAAMLAAVPSGRYLAGWLAGRARRAAIYLSGHEPGRDEIEADWQRRRQFDMASAIEKHRRTFGEYDEAQRRLLTFAGMDPDHVVLRWGNFDKTVMLPATVYEPDDSGRSYRLRPGVRSIWVRNFPMKGDVKAFFQVPDRPEAAELVKGTGATIVEGSAQTTNSWGLRGPEPQTAAPWRGIVLGDSYMQGLFVADDQTPTECLKRHLGKRLGGPIEVLNTGHLGYSTEQYYHALVEYAHRFPPQFVVVSVFANDFAGDIKVVLEGRGGDWDEGKFWLGRIRELCAGRGIPCLFVPAPWVHQLDEAQLSGNYPGPVSNASGVGALQFLDPIDAFADELLAIEIDGLKKGRPVTGDPLFNGRIGDGHFSPRGCEIWAERVGRRVALLLMRQLAGTAGPL
jgi:hypothetical protein